MRNLKNLCGATVRIAFGFLRYLINLVNWNDFKYISCTPYSCANLKERKPAKTCVGQTDVVAVEPKISMKQDISDVSVNESEMEETADNIESIEAIAEFIFLSDPMHNEK